MYRVGQKPGPLCFTAYILNFIHQKVGNTQRLVLMEERSAVSPTQGKRDVAAAEAVDQLEQPRRQAAKLSTGRPSSTCLLYTSPSPRDS